MCTYVLPGPAMDVHTEGVHNSDNVPYIMLMCSKKDTAENRQEYTESALCIPPVIWCHLNKYILSIIFHNIFTRQALSYFI